MKCSLIRALHNSLLKAGVRKCFADTGILNWHFFSLGTWKALFLHLVQSQVGNQLRKLTDWPAKYI